MYAGHGKVIGRSGQNLAGALALQEHRDAAQGAMNHECSLLLHVRCPLQAAAYQRYCRCGAGLVPAHHPGVRSVRLARSLLLNTQIGLKAPGCRIYRTHDRSEPEMPEDRIRSLD